MITVRIYSDQAWNPLPDVQKTPLLLAGRKLLRPLPPPTGTGRHKADVQLCCRQAAARGQSLPRYARSSTTDTERYEKEQGRSEPLRLDVDTGEVSEKK